METIEAKIYPGVAIKLLYLDSGRYTPDSLAEKAGISLQTMNRILNGEEYVNESLSAKLCTALDMEENRFWFHLQQQHDADEAGVIESFNRKTALLSFKDQEHAILAAMAAGFEQTDSDVDMTYTRIQCMNLMFFIDKEMGELAGMNYFNFQPWKFGAFDKEVYSAIEKLVDWGYIKEYGEDSSSYFELTEKGLEAGSDRLARVISEFSEYFRETARWLKSQDFDSIVWTAYSMYPEMKTEVSDFKDTELKFEDQCGLVLDRILHRRRQLFEDIGCDDEYGGEMVEPVQLEDDSAIENPTEDRSEYNLQVRHLNKEVLENAYSRMLKREGLNPCLKCNYDKEKLDQLINFVAAYSAIDIVELAAAYLVEIIKSKPFVIGSNRMINEKMAVLVCELFLCMNGHGGVQTMANGTLELLQDMVAVDNEGISDVAAMFRREIVAGYSERTKIVH